MVPRQSEHARVRVCTRMHVLLGASEAAAVLQEVEWGGAGAGAAGSAATAGALAASVKRAEKRCQQEGTCKASASQRWGFVFRSLTSARNQAIPSSSKAEAPALPGVM